MRMAKGSLSWVLTSFSIGLIFLVLFIVFNNFEFGSVFLLISVFLFLLTFFSLVFFRDPERNIGDGVVACADGKIKEIITINDPDVGESIKVSTFMNIHNVHVNRMPFDGTIKKIVHISGFHIPAFKKESEKNERVIIIIDTAIGTVKIIQIAGTIARRIVPYNKKGDKLKKGERIGIIRLGSRVDLYLPSSKIKNLNVRVGDRVKSGEDKIAEVNA